MATKPIKPVSREVDLGLNGGDRGPYIVTLLPGGVLSFRRKGCRLGVEIALTACHYYACQVKAMEHIVERKTKRIVRRAARSILLALTVGLAASLLIGCEESEASLRLPSETSAQPVASRATSENISAWVRRARQVGGVGSIPAARADSQARLFRRICLVESGDRLDAYNPAERAAGPAQIRPICVEDCNRIVGYERWTLADRYDRAESFAMFKTYTGHYQAHYNLSSPESAARIWNGGPTGWKKKSTEKYWRKVKAVQLTKRNKP